MRLGLVKVGTAAWFAGKLQTRAGGETQDFCLEVSGLDWFWGKWVEICRFALCGVLTRECNAASGLDGCFGVISHQLIPSSPKVKGKDQGSWNQNVKFSDFSAV